MNLTGKLIGALGASAIVLSPIGLWYLGSDDSTAAASADTSNETYGSLASPPLPKRDQTGSFDPDTSVANYDGSAVANLTENQLSFEFVGESPIVLDVPRPMELRAISTIGSKAALVDAANGRSEILVVGVDGSRRSYMLDGRVEPEAFSTDGQTLFVVDHEEAPEAQDSASVYRIRPLDLETGSLEVILGPSKVPLEEDMKGQARRQVWGSDTQLYTLYIRQSDHGGHTHASGEVSHDGFIHILDLAEEWAFCLDLPESFGKGSLNSTALASDGSDIAVVDLTAEQVAFASADTRTVDRVVDLPKELAEWDTAEAELHVGYVSGALLVADASSGKAQWFDADSMAAISDQIALGGGVIGVSSSGEEVAVWFSGNSPRWLTPPEVSN